LRGEKSQNHIFVDGCIKYLPKTAGCCDGREIHTCERYVVGIKASSVAISTTPYPFNGINLCMNLSGYYENRHKNACSCLTCSVRILHRAMSASHTAGDVDLDHRSVTLTIEQQHNTTTDTKSNSSRPDITASIATVRATEYPSLHTSITCSRELSAAFQARLRPKCLYVCMPVCPSVHSSFRFALCRSPCSFPLGGSRVVPFMWLTVRGLTRHGTSPGFEVGSRAAGLGRWVARDGSPVVCIGIDWAVVRMEGSCEEMGWG
jgi:hypothetical protein